MQGRALRRVLTFPKSLAPMPGYIWVGVLSSDGFFCPDRADSLEVSRLPWSEPPALPLPFPLLFFVQLWIRDFILRSAEH
jgi:hypothetical protein